MLSDGQVSDAFANVGMTATPQQIQQYSNDSSFDGQAGQNALMQQLSPSGYTNYQNTQATNQAKATYQAGIGSAVSTLQNAGTTLDTQYQGLLQDVLGVGSVSMNTATTGENNLLGQRGITNNSPLYSQQMTLAQLPVTSQVQGAVGSLGYTEAGLQNQLAQNIAGVQAGGAGTLAELPLSYGSLALAQAANVANIQLAGSKGAQAGAGARYISGPNGVIYDTVGGTFITGQTPISSGNLQYVNGQWLKV